MKTTNGFGIRISSRIGEWTFLTMSAVCRHTYMVPELSAVATGKLFIILVFSSKIWKQNFN